MIIKSPEDLKNAFLCFCIFHYFNYHAEEEFIEQNPDIVNPYPFIASCMYNNQFYKNEDGISLACIINDNDLISVKSYPEIMMLDETGYGDLSLRDRFDFVRQISISASNKLLK